MHTGLVTACIQASLKHVDRLRVDWLYEFWEEFRESRRCSRDTHPE